MAIHLINLVFWALIGHLALQQTLEGQTLEGQTPEGQILEYFFGTNPRKDIP